MKCCLCGKEFEGYGNNPSPIEVYYSSIGESGRCCDECNSNIVIPIRISEMGFIKSVKVFIEDALSEGEEE